MTENSERPAAIPDLVGLEWIAAFYKVSPNTVYSWKSRGEKLGTPDLSVPTTAAAAKGGGSRRSTTDIWYADRFRDPANSNDIDLGERPPLPQLLGIAQVAEAFGVTKKALEKWSERTRDTDDPAATLPPPPEPRLKISRTPLWLPEDWRSWAEATHRPYNPPPPSERTK
jgi:hypothetical protein